MIKIIKIFSWVIECVWLEIFIPAVVEKPNECVFKLSNKNLVELKQSANNQKIKVLLRKMLLEY
jgi:hypothetical protein